MNLWQRYWLAGSLGLAGWCALCPPWRIHVIQKGDDRTVAWRSAPIWSEAGFAPAVLAAAASERLGVSVPPAEVEARLHTERAWFQLGGVLSVAGLGWLALHGARRNER